MSRKDFRNLFVKHARMDDRRIRIHEGLPEVPFCIRGNDDIPDHSKVFNSKLNKHVRPTTVQRHVIPVIMAGRDLIACAPSGSGRIGAFCIPIIHGLMREPRSKSYGTAVFPLALILCPTEHRAKEVFTKLDCLCRETGVKVRYAVNLTFRLSVKKSDDADILIATPQQILKILDVPEFVDKPRLALMKLKYLVLDEGDELLSKFPMDIRMIIKNTDMASPGSDMASFGSRQTMFFGSSFPSELQRLAYEDFLSPDYVFFCQGKDDSSEFSCHDIRNEMHNSKASSDYYCAVAASGGHGNDTFRKADYDGYGYFAPALSLADFLSYQGDCDWEGGLVSASATI